MLVRAPACGSSGHFEAGARLACQPTAVYGDGTTVAAGPQTLRVQTREDGFAIDQVALSPVTFVNSSPGTVKNDTRILPASQ